MNEDKEVYMIGNAESKKRRREETATENTSKSKLYRSEQAESEKRMHEPLEDMRKDSFIDKKFLTKDQRRLDSLARVLEAGSKCCAVYLDGTEILVTDNNIHNNARDNEHIIIKIKALKYLQSIKDMKEYKPDEAATKLLIEIFWAKIHDLISASPNLHLKLDKEIQERIISHVLANSSKFENILNKKIGFFLDFLPEGKKNSKKLLAVHFAMQKAIELV